MRVAAVIPWEDPGWDAYVGSHPGGSVYHTSTWCRIVAEVGRYRPTCLAAREGDRLVGVLPAMDIRSPLTGHRMVALPFSDACPPLADDAGAATALLDGAVGACGERGASFLEMRGAPLVRAGDSPAPEARGFSRRLHFSDYTIPLTTDIEAIRRRLSRKAVRQTINKGVRLGVTVRRGGVGDLGEFYRLYTRNRRRHGIPPQPAHLFTTIFERMRGDGSGPEASIYMAEHEGRAVAALVMFRYRGVTYAKFEGVDERARDLQPVYPLFWTTVEEAALAGDHTYDFGRTAADNPGLNDFKRRWGTERQELPYYFHPPREGVSVVKRASLKYRAFTAVFRRLPTPLAVAIGRRIFRHFG